MLNEEFLCVNLQFAHKNPSYLCVNFGFTHKNPKFLALSRGLLCVNFEFLCVKSPSSQKKSPLRLARSGRREAVWMPLYPVTADLS